MDGGIRPGHGGAVACSRASACLPRAVALPQRQIRLPRAADAPLRGAVVHLDPRLHKGLFNQHWGEVNIFLKMIMEPALAMLGMQWQTPDWFSDPHLALAMLLLVNAGLATHT